MSFDYARLSVAEKWQWHAEIYAMRRVVMHVDRDERTSPSDPRGEWFDDRLVDAAEQRLRTKFRERAALCRGYTEAENVIRFRNAETWRNSPAGQAFIEAWHGKWGRNNQR